MDSQARFHPVDRETGQPLVAVPERYLRLKRRQRRTQLRVVALFALFAVLSIFLAAATWGLLKSGRGTPHSQNTEAALLAPRKAQSLLELEFEHWTPEKIDSEFREFIARHSRTYSGREEWGKRKEIFQMNLEFVKRHNSNNHTYSLDVNGFADLTFEEFRHALGLKKRSGLQAAADNNVDWKLLKIPDGELPLQVDWREKGCVTPVKDQKTCGSCWAFSTTGALEGAVCAQTRELQNFSEQQLVDCSKDEGNEGCNGGEVNFAISYVERTEFLCSEDSYPYKAEDGRCEARNCRYENEVWSNVVIEGFKDVPKRSEKAMKAALKLHGPVSVAIEADERPFQFYKSGVFDAPCGKDLNHAVLVVGYQDDPKQPFWIVKNSWGTKWGEEGYMKMAMRKERDGQCGVLLQASYPVVVPVPKLDKEHRRHD